MKPVMKFVVFRLVNTIKLFGFHLFIFGYIKPSAAKTNTGIKGDRFVSGFQQPPEDDLLWPLLGIGVFGQLN